MRPSKRREEILRRLRADGEVDIMVLSQAFEVSDMTIRRDLETLESEGHARRVRGGAISAISRSYEPPLLERQVTATKAKQAIGRCAASHVQDGDCVILDVGSTTLEVARNLRSLRGLTVLTTSLPIAYELSRSPDVRVIMTGGEVRPHEFSLIGGLAVAGFRGLNCDVAFLGAAGIHPERGVTEYNLEDARVKQAALDVSRRCIVVADATKLGKVGFAEIAPLTAVDLLVTDAPQMHSIVQAIREAGTDVISTDTCSTEMLTARQPV